MTRQFHAPWQYFKRTSDAFTTGTGTTTATATRAMAITYISGWIWDLYVSIRESVRKISSTAFSQYYHHELSFTAGRWDPFLHHLNSVIRPTHIHNALEDAIYIPQMPTIHPESPNPWNVTNFSLDEDFLQAIHSVMDAKSNEWELIDIDSNTFGRPMWLLDWKSERAYAWFPQENNYSREDLIAAQILGIPCTPRLAPRDIDDWQIFPQGKLPTTGINISDYQRVSARNFTGSSEYRTLEHAEYDHPTYVAQPVEAGSKRQTTEKSSSSLQLSKESNTPQPMEITDMVPTIPASIKVIRFRLTDWCYHAQVVLNTTNQMQNLAFRNFLFKVKPTK